MNKNQRSLFVFKKEYENIIFVLAKGEGSTMTFAQTVATLHNQIVTAKPSDVSLVRNLKKGLDYVLDLLESGHMTFSKSQLCKINQLVAFDDNQDTLGDFRKGAIYINGSKHQGVNSPEMLNVFQQLHTYFDRLDKNNENIIKLALKLCRHQFFGNGNKRTAQLMMNGLLVKNGFMPFVLDFKEEENINVLLQYYDENNIEPLYETCLKHQQIIYQSYKIPNSQTE